MQAAEPRGKDATGAPAALAAPRLEGWLDAGLLVLSALAPACLAASQVGNVADAAHDVGVARVLGLDAQPWRELDRLVELALFAVPLGTRAARAGLCGALAVGAAGAVIFLVTRELLRSCAPTKRLGPLVATIAAMSAALAPTWQGEAGPGGAAIGGVIALAPLLLLGRLRRNVRYSAEAPDGCRGAAFFLALGLGHEPLAGAVTAVACVAGAALAPDVWRLVRAAWNGDRAGLAGWTLAGAAPGVLSIVQLRRTGGSAAALASAAFPGGPFMPKAWSAFALLRAELGAVVGAFVVVGVVLALLVPRARPLAVSLATLAVVGTLAGALGAPVGPSHVDAPILAAFAAACALAGVAMQAAVRVVSEARVPFASASAAMVVVLELAIPVNAADESLLRARPGQDVALWDELAWDVLPPRAVVLVTSPRVGARAAAARAEGSLRDDLTLVLAYASADRVGRALSRDAALVPLWRDLDLEGAPSPASLSALATTRAVATSYEPRWGKELGRHLVPTGLLDLFEPEPRGASDRRKGLVALRPFRERLAHACERDAELADATALLLRARATDLAATGDRDLVGGAIEDLRAFAPGDPAGAEIVGHAVLPR